MRSLKQRVNWPLLTIVSLLLICAGQSAYGQRGRKNDKQEDQGFREGDIISFLSSHEKELTYGLVIGIKFGDNIKVETFDEEGEIQLDTVSDFFNKPIKLLDRMKKSKSAPKMRVWKTADGKFSVKASLLKVDGGQVKLKKADNRVITVPMEKLSERDQQFLEAGKQEDSQQSDNPFAGGELAAADPLDDPVQALIERRKQLLEEQKIHQLLAKWSPDLIVGDIIKFEDSQSYSYGVVAETGHTIDVERIDDRGELRSTFLHRDRWWFVDREPPQLPVRTWKSLDRKFKIEAKLTDVADKKAVLEKADGTTVRVPLSKLSRGDRKYAMTNRRVASVQVPPEVLARRDSYGEHLQQLLDRRFKLMGRQTANATAALDAASIEGISLIEKPINFNKVDLTPAEISRLPSFETTVRIKAFSSPKVENIRCAEESSFVAFAIQSFMKKRSSLVVVDINRNTPFTNDPDTDPIDGDAEVLAISPSGETIILFSKDSQNKGQLELWSFENDVLSRKSIVSFDSYYSPQVHLFSDELGYYTDKSGNLFFFEAGDRIRPTHSIDIGGRGIGRPNITLTGDRQSLVVIPEQETALFVIDLESKTCQGRVILPEPDSDRNAYRISEDGRSITRIGRGGIEVIDLTSGKVVDRHEIAPGISFENGRGKDPNRSVIDEGLVKTFTAKVYDYRLKAIIGDLNGGDDSVSFHGDTAFFSVGCRIIVRPVDDTVGASDSSTQDQNTIPVKIKIENLDLKAIQNHAKSLSDQDIVTFGPSSKLKLVFKTPGTTEKWFRPILEERMKKSGIEISETADFELVLFYEEGKAEQRKYEIVGQFGLAQKTRNVTVTPKRISATLNYRGDQIWSRHQSVRFDALIFSEQDLNERIKQSSQTNPSLFEKFDYPTKLRLVNPKQRKSFVWR